MPYEKACDRCHTIKSRCLPGPGTDCYRCYRLQHHCTYSRQTRKRGPKRRTRPAVSTTFVCTSRRSESLSENSSSPNYIHTPILEYEHKDQEWGTLVGSLPPDDLLLESSAFRWSQYRSYTIYGFFSFGPLLGSEMSRTIQRRLEEAPALLIHPYAAVTRVFLRCMASQSPCDDIDWSHCASALETLRNAHITKYDHVGIFLALGMSLVTFHRLISGASASTICRFTLSLIRPFYYRGHLNELENMELLSFIFLDTTQSLFRAQIPVIQYQVRDPYFVDQHAGLCGPLLPILYRICLLAQTVRTGRILELPDPGHFERLADELRVWAPQISQPVLDSFSDNEMMLLIFQANLHRTAALLILHRLRYPFGEQDFEAENLSAAIVRDMTVCLDIVGYYPPNITLVLLVAGVETHDLVGRQKVLDLVGGIRGAKFYPFVSNLRMLLHRVWDERDRGSVQYLFLIFEKHPELSIPL